MTRVLAISSTGGHWVQLMRLSPAWDDCETHYACTSPDHWARVEAAANKRGQKVAGYYPIIDANRWSKVKLVRQMLQVAMLLIRLRPDVIITTGASVGYFAIRIGKLLGARTCWIDSIANAEQLSLSGAKSGPHANLFLTQWPEIAKPGGPEYRGSVL